MLKPILNGANLDLLSITLDLLKKCLLSLPASASQVGFKLGRSGKTNADSYQEGELPRQLSGARAII